MPFEDLVNPEKWVHEYAYIYPNGKLLDIQNENQIARLAAITSDQRIIFIVYIRFSFERRFSCLEH